MFGVVLQAWTAPHLCSTHAETYVQQLRDAEQAALTKALRMSILSVSFAGFGTGLVA